MEFCAMLLCTCMFRFVRDFRFFLHVDLFHDVDFNFFLLLFNNNYGKEKKSLERFYAIFIELFDVFFQLSCYPSLLAIILKKISVVQATALHT